MMIVVIAGIMFTVGGLTAQESPPALAVDSTCLQYAETHTLVRNDVVTQLNADHKNISVCENSLSDAQKSLRSLKSDAELLQRTVQDQRAIIAEYKAQKRVLESYIEKLESASCPEPGLLTGLRQSWEEVDGLVALGGGYALGTGMCIGLAYVFNQPAFQR